ncbi:MAG: hypothetical protein GY953_37325 [bacterium]|nr:hypothetical protein [bacterium]
MLRAPKARRLNYWLRQIVVGSVFARTWPLLWPLAFAWRRVLFRTTFIAITGSLGKTTAKECLGRVLGEAALTFRTHRNQNSRRMVGLNLLRVRPWHRFAVIEVASAAPGTMERTARLLRPDVAIILTVQRTHSNSFRDLEQHAAEKAVLLRRLSRGGLALLNGDDPLVAPMARAVTGKVRLFGRAPGCHYSAGQVRADWPGRLRCVLSTGSESLLVKTQLVGEHWLPAALATLAAADSAGVKLDCAAASLAKAQPFPGRLAPYRIPSGAIVLRDDYNSSVTSTDASLRVLESATAKRRVLVITDMSDHSGHRKHRRRYIAERLPGVADLVVFVGEMSEYGARRAVDAGLDPDSAHGFPTLKQAAEFLRAELREGDLVLVKGRTTDHAARLFLAQLGDVGCWKEYCPKRMLCDICWELDIPPEQLRQAVPV